YGNPVFTEKELITIISQVELKNFTHLPEPHEGYRQMFTAVPQTIEMINGRYIGTTADGQTCRIPGAFADWPPQDTQPPWGDVTYLRMYTHPDFNYIAYNTIRMYASQLVSEAFINRPLWDAIAGIIPYYQKTFGIDGVMIDMGHALPSELKREMVAAARSLNSDFAFWDENFSVSKKSRDENYNAVIGNLALILHKLPDLKTVLKNLAVMDVPIPFFAAAESHNTPRVAARFAGEAGMNFSKVVAALGAVLPAVPFIHSGFELGERFPINTGIGFLPGELGNFPSEKLPLFSTSAYKWAGGNETPPIISYLVKLAAARKKYLEVITNPDADSMAIIDLENPNIIAMLRKVGTTTLLYLGNFNPNAAETASVPVKTTKTHFTDAIDGVNVPVVADRIEIALKAGESVLLEV
ncbi:MAG: alpha-amylase, partial [Rhizobacter sp.]|nr:alpha-amylase [Chlorobiales bacterium]